LPDRTSTSKRCTRYTPSPMHSWVRYSRAAGAPLSSWRTPMRTSASKGVCRSSATSPSLTGCSTCSAGGGRPGADAPRRALQLHLCSSVAARGDDREDHCDADLVRGGQRRLADFLRQRLTREYPIEKILRDARASLIEDGCNEILAIKGRVLPDRSRFALIRKHTFENSRGDSEMATTYEVVLYGASDTPAS